MPEFDGPVDDVVDPDDAVNTLSYRRIMGWGLISLVPMIVVWGNVYPHALTVSPNRLYHADEVMAVITIVVLCLFVLLPVLTHYCEVCSERYRFRFRFIPYVFAYLIAFFPFFILMIHDYADGMKLVDITNAAEYDASQTRHNVDLVRLSAPVQSNSYRVIVVGYRRRVGNVIPDAFLKTVTWNEAIRACGNPFPLRNCNAGVSSARYRTDFWKFIAREVMGVNYGNGNEYGNAVKIAIPDNDVARRIYYRPKKR